MKQRLSIYSVWIIMIVAIVAAHSKAPFKELKIIDNDVNYLYSYLPATLIYHDLEYKYIATADSVTVAHTWLNNSPINRGVSKMTCGTAFMMLPFFCIAHVIASFSSIPATGYSWIYDYFLVLSALFYLCLALLLLRSLLLKYFNELIVSMVLISIFGATNLYHYSTFEGGMTHTYSFFLFTAFLWLTIAWHNIPKTKYMLLLGLVSGLIVLIRPTNVVVLLLFLLYKPDKLLSYSDKFLYFKKNIIQFIPLAIIAVGIFFIQLMYWKITTGSWFYFSYGDEGFFFSHPHIIDGLFSFRKGWLVYTPIMIFAIVGMFLLRKKEKSFFLPVLLFFILNIYIVFSWWCWWYGGSFGARPLIESYAIMAIPLAVFYKVVLNKKIIVKYVTIVTMCTLVFLNIFQTYQYHHGIIHWDSMTKLAYWKVFLKSSSPKNYNHYLSSPAYEKAMKGEE